MQQLAPWQIQFCESWQLPHDYAENVTDALSWFKSAVSDLQQPICIAISGCQGSGKSTLSAYFVAYLRAQGFSAETVSLDDFYLSKNQRLELAGSLHPAFETRGVPGTHNVKAAQTVLESFKNRKSLVLPRFDKSTDNPLSEDLWTKVNAPLDVLIFEGWCLGVPPEPEERLKLPCNQFEMLQDHDASFRSTVNMFLAADYQSLFSKFDKLIFLNGKSFKHVFKWRAEQEQKLIAKTGRGLSEQQIEAFIQSYQRLTEWGINQLPQVCDFELELDAHRKILNKQRGK
ncbi:hypothetical protein N474_02320 [Pseudoalteromonas luteoviolacea CPMOR-2]|uniref:Phosphoribulokinase/uridine kinase domain-containing protein n=1 Tax=Pseudoalteromonas luteoviolacea DSM 6061 TaxID=1365250 RepID=A0A166V530_9GAMM|nr:hypothetical protein [Pseudoalteromonas luteoviolacea]KZN31721.1 hypothetical protein N475_04500 [Pseudoalteromonas luteoviolacea DSM 6061]KZN54581.1 hypothetical protein N474_02320 [Pseudoalteromonas luteoviolacea CPMOR-2]MBE0389058.1 D-glycerate 3-kinase [Pseudoalteromonas luteoviolacea DSM 6061]